MVTSSEDRALLWSRDFVVRSPFRFGESYGQRSHEFYTVYSTTTNNSKPRPQCNTRRRPATCEARLTTALVTPPYIGHKSHRGAWGNAGGRATFTSALHVIRGVECSITRHASVALQLCDVVSSSHRVSFPLYYNNTSSSCLSPIRSMSRRRRLHKSCLSATRASSALARRSH